MNEKITLSDLTKEELIKLIERKMFFTITYRDIWWVRYQSLNAQAKEKRDQSIALGSGLATVKESMKLWDEADRIQERADAFYRNNTSNEH